MVNLTYLLLTESQCNEMHTSLSLPHLIRIHPYLLMQAPYKMVLCVNMSLNMGKGKIAAQCCHATLGAYQSASKHCSSSVRWWQRTGNNILSHYIFPAYLLTGTLSYTLPHTLIHLLGQAKIAVKVDNDAQLSELEAQARAAGLVSYVVLDAGRTQIAAGSRTVLAIGPAPAAVIDKITSHLKLL